jgi:hypothetical protein
MSYDPLSIFELCGICGGAFLFVGFSSLLVAVRKGRREFRAKGYLRPPAGKEWFRFLMGRHYDAFGNPGTRLFFTISHFCLMGIIFILVVVVVLFGCEQLLKNVTG